VEWTGDDLWNILNLQNKELYRLYEGFYSGDKKTRRETIRRIANTKRNYYKQGKIAMPERSQEYDPNLDPQMVWTGKSERESFEIPAPSIHVHEELSAQKIISSVRKNRLDNFLFDFEELDPGASVEFYEHELSWSNRLILGDSLIVMNSLLNRERMAGQVQAIYMDPPYGVKYNSNFQPRIGDTDVKDRNDADLTREPEMIQAYRDTWELEVHSYLTHMRDRLTVARELLADTGSIFLQISDENVHRVRLLMDEVFGAENFISMISYVTTGGFAQSTALSRAGDYLLWYSKDTKKKKVLNGSA
jgi:adenine-specific DNA-methyltransferase